MVMSKIMKIFPNTKGYFSPIEQKIVVKEELPQLQEIKTLAHEIAHSLAHDKNNQRIEGLEVAEMRKVKELEAESAAYIFCQHFGLDTSDYSLNYIAGWGAEPTTDLLKASMDNIAKISGKMILEAKEHMNLEMKKDISKTININKKNIIRNDIDLEH